MPCCQFYTQSMPTNMCLDSQIRITFIHNIIGIVSIYTTLKTKKSQTQIGEMRKFIEIINLAIWIHRDILRWHSNSKIFSWMSTFKGFWSNCCNKREQILRELYKDKKL